jgi:hypothetical protein
MLTSTFSVNYSAFRLISSWPDNQARKCVLLLCRAITDISKSYWLHKHNVTRSLASRSEEEMYHFLICTSIMHILYSFPWVRHAVFQDKDTKLPYRPPRSVTGTFSLSSFFFLSFFFALHSLCVIGHLLFVKLYVLCFVWAWCVILCDMCICMLWLTVVPLPPDKNPFAVQINNNNNKRN